MMRAALTIAIAASLAGCQTPPPRVQIVTKEVSMPVHAPCPEPQQKPARPTSVHQDNPVMPTDPVNQARILAGKVLEWITYGEKADGVMTACGK